MQNRKFRWEYQNNVTWDDKEFKDFFCQCSGMDTTTQERTEVLQKSNVDEEEWFETSCFYNGTSYVWWIYEKQDFCNNYHRQKSKCQKVFGHSFTFSRFLGPMWVLPSSGNKSKAIRLRHHDPNYNISVAYFGFQFTTQYYYINVMS